MGKGRNRRRSRKPRGGEWERSGHFNRHHMLPRSRGGDMSKQNLLIMDTTRHKCWHILFQNLTFPEVAALLLRCEEVKKRGLLQSSTQLSRLQSSPEGGHSGDFKRLEDGGQLPLFEVRSKRRH